MEKGIGRPASSTFQRRVVGKGEAAQTVMILARRPLRVVASRADHKRIGRMHVDALNVLASTAKATPRRGILPRGSQLPNPVAPKSTNATTSGKNDEGQSSGNQASSGQPSLAGASGRTCSGAGSSQHEFLRKRLSF